MALAWVSSTCPWKLRFYENKLKNPQWLLGNVTLIHRNRESNDLANCLAKEGASMDNAWAKWFPKDGLDRGDCDGVRVDVVF